MRKSSAFTLIELLIVIAIIGILMGLLFPAVNGVIDTARKTAAKTDVTQIATAIINYETEYGKLPLPTKTTLDKALVDILTGIDTNAANNPRGIVFIEVGARKPDTLGKGGKSGTNSTGAFVDPWGAPYKILMDADYNNTIEEKAGDEPGPTVTGIRKKVVVWNKAEGKDAAQKKRRSVVSWE